MAVPVIPGESAGTDYSSSVSGGAGHAGHVFFAGGSGISVEKI